MPFSFKTKINEPKKCFNNLDVKSNYAKHLIDRENTFCYVNQKS